MSVTIPSPSPSPSPSPVESTAAAPREPRSWEAAHLIAEYSGRAPSRSVLRRARHRRHSAPVVWAREVLGRRVVRSAWMVFARTTFLFGLVGWAALITVIV